MAAVGEQRGFWVVRGGGGLTIHPHVAMMDC